MAARALRGGGLSALAAAAGLAWAAANAPGWRSFGRALEDPEAAQAVILRRTLRRNASTAFGRAHGFAEIRNADQYRERVPLASYADLAGWIERVARGESRVLTAAPVLALEGSGGSSAAAKRIPYTADLQAELRRAVAPWVFDLYRRRPRLALGPAYWSITPVAREPALQDGAVAVGFAEDSEYLGSGWRRLVDATLAVPGAVRHVRDVESFRYVTLLFLLRARGLRLISVWHPSFLTLLLEVLPERWEALLRDLERGGLTPPLPLAPWLQRALSARLAPRPTRAAELRRLGPGAGAALWPRLGLISAWGDAHATLALPELRRAFPGVEVQPKGLLATEGCVSIPYAAARPLAIRSHFLEFLEDGRSRLAHELRPGGVYSVVLTTGGGLYRYRLEDRVEVTGQCGRTPTLRFLGKQDHVSDLCGEKLSEALAAVALAALFGSERLAPRFALLAPDLDGPPPGYTLYLETDAPPPLGLAARLDRELCASPDYAYARDLGQLREARVFQVEGAAFPRYQSRSCESGQRLGDVKPLALSPRAGWSKLFPGDYLCAEGALSARS